MPDAWIIVCKWREFQHYTKRDPLWIKNYTRLLANDDYLALSEHCALVLHRLWLAYASSNGQLLANTASLSRHLGVRVSSVQLKTLVDAGWITLSASKPLALARARALATEVETEKEKTLVKDLEPELRRDPEAAAKIQELAARIGRKI